MLKYIQAKIEIKKRQMSRHANDNYLYNGAAASEPLTRVVHGAPVTDKVLQQKFDCMCRFDLSFETLNY